MIAFCRAAPRVAELLALRAQVLFTWSGWAATPAAEIRKAPASGDPGDGSTCYRRWLAALERWPRRKALQATGILDERRASDPARPADSPGQRSVAGAGDIGLVKAHSS